MSYRLEVLEEFAAMVVEVLALRYQAEVAGRLRIPPLSMQALARKASHKSNQRPSSR